MPINQPLNKPTSKLALVIVIFSLTTCLPAQDGQQAAGRVYHDKNFNNQYDTGEPLLSGIRVSNGESIVTTDSTGSYELAISDDTILFVIKPQGWRTPVNEDQIPQFYYIHKPAGSPVGYRFKGVSPTGPLPKSVDFPLYPQKEPDNFKAILFADPQPRNQQEVDYVIREVVEEIIGTDAAFGVTLGDIMFNNLDLFGPQNQGIALIGIPWYNVIGNHDNNAEAPSDELSDETFERIYGPAYYSFDYGQAHFVVLDNVEWYHDKAGKKMNYRGGLGKRQMTFLTNDLADVPAEKLVVLLMHIPLLSTREKSKIFRLIEQRPFTLSVSGHQHYQRHLYLDKEDDWQGKTPHHHVINVTAGGSWWSGMKRYGGAPHAYSRDGTPNGYSIVTFDGNQYAFQYKAAGKPASYQMHISAPAELSSTAEPIKVYANVFAGSTRTHLTAVLRNNKGTLKTLKVEHAPDQRDPDLVALAEAEDQLRTTLGKQVTWSKMSQPIPAHHLWAIELPDGLKPGVYAIQVTAVQPDGTRHTGLRTLRVVEK